MTQLTLWFGDQDTYEVIDDDANSEVVALTPEGAALVASGTTLKKFTEEEEKRCIIGRVSISTLLEFYLEHHRGFLEPEHRPLYKTEITIWSDYDPQGVELADLARDAVDGGSYCSKQETTLIENPTLDTAWDGTEFFNNHMAGAEGGDDEEA